MTVRSSFDKSLNEVSFIATTYMKSDDSIINKWIFKTPIQEGYNDILFEISQNVADNGYSFEEHDYIFKSIDVAVNGSQAIEAEIKHEHDTDDLVLIKNGQILLATLSQSEGSS